MWSGASNPWAGGGAFVSAGVAGREVLSGEGGSSARTSCDCDFPSPDGRPCGSSTANAVTSDGSPWTYNPTSQLCESSVTCSLPCSNCYKSAGSLDLADVAKGGFALEDLQAMCREAGWNDRKACVRVSCTHKEGRCFCYVRCCASNDGSGCADCEEVLIDGSFPLGPFDEREQSSDTVAEVPCWALTLQDAIEATKENWAKIQEDIERAEAVYDALAEESRKWIDSWGIDWGEGDGVIAGTWSPCRLYDCLRGVKSDDFWVANCRKCFPTTGDGSEEDEERTKDRRECIDLGTGQNYPARVREREHFCANFF